MQTTQSKQTDALALTLAQARKSRTTIDPLSKSVPDLTLQRAYEIQQAGIALRLREGEKIVGMKMGLTSKAKQEQMGLEHPIYGVLTSTMILENGGRLDLENMIQPKGEVEIAFRLSRTLSEEIHLEQAKEFVSSFCIAIEFVDSSYHGFKYFSLPDVVADNTSSGRVVFGPEHSIKLIKSIEQFSEYRLELKTDSTVCDSAMSREISGQPLQSLVDLSRLYCHGGKQVPAGSWILAGSATRAYSVDGHTSFYASSDGLGEVRLSVA